MERSPLFCAVCDADLTLDEVVVAYDGRLDSRGSRAVPLFIHPYCDPEARVVVNGRSRLGKRRLRELVVEAIRARARA
jgi:hypothetical protein